MLLKGYDHELINLLPPDAVLVLESGCGEGSLGANYKRRNPAGTYIGIESDAHRAARAAQVLDRVITGKDAARSHQAADVSNIDCLLVHLDHPLFAGMEAGQAIRQLSSAVSARGVVLLAFANHRHWSSVRSVFQDHNLSGMKNLSGILNQPQFRLKQVKEIIRDAGLKIVNIWQIEETGRDYRKILQTAQELLKSQGLDFTAIAGDIGQAYFIIRAVKTLPDRRMLIQSMTLEPVAACNDKRIHEPVLFLGTIPGVMTSTAVNSLAISPHTKGGSQVLVWQRPILTRPASLITLRQLIKAGYLVIVEFDDDPRRWQKIVDNDYLSFRGVHGVQTSTGPLAEFLRKFNPNVGIFPNQILELPVQKTRQDSSIVRIFFGALNRVADWQPLMPALNRVLKRFKQDLHVNVVNDHVFYEQLETPMKSFQPLCGYEQYLKILQDSDIGLLPLEPTEFNQYKSDLKFIENAAYGVVSLASPTVYGDSIQDGVTGVLFHDADEFENKLSALIADRNARSRISEQAFNLVKSQRMLNKHYRKRHEWYQQMLDNLPELNRDLQKRVPELFVGLD